MFLLFYTLFFIAGCTTASSSFNEKADGLGFDRRAIRGLRFEHTIFTNSAAGSSGTLNVYLGGDGSPWFQGRYITRDPTPLKPVMLQLMKMDKEPAIYLGRPCYHQSTMPENCAKRLWTNQRYSKEVVDSMLAALKAYLSSSGYGYQKVRLFGFSGGGTLAMLIAPRLRQTETVITLAGNIDTDAWVAHHGYLPLTGSLNPSLRPSLPTHIQQYHLAGELDRNIPPFIIEKAASKQTGAKYIFLRGADHHCCWSNKWPDILSSLN